MYHKKIDTLLLDLGGVLIDVDYAGSAKAFEQLGHTGFDRVYSKAKQTDLFDKFETGELNVNGFRKNLRELLGAEISDNDIDHCWNAMLGTIPEARIDLLKKLKRRYRLLLLSNTNNIHVPAFTRIILEKNGIPDFSSLFDGAYFSCEIGLRKPHTKAYLHVLQKHGATPDRTLFIDDSIQHVEGARQAGLHAEHLELSREDIVTLASRLQLI
jgi:putative hydrolase of the HAD superfamily